MLVICIIRFSTLITIGKTVLKNYGTGKPLHILRDTKKNCSSQYIIANSTGLGCALGGGAAGNDSKLLPSILFHE